MSAGIYNFVLDQGSTWNLNIVYKDPSGTPINLTGYTAEMQIRETPSNNSVLTLSTGGNGIVITGSTGNIALTATDEQTGAIDSGMYVYDLELNIAGVRTRLIQGSVTVSAEVTQ